MKFTLKDALAQAEKPQVSQDLVSCPLLKHSQ